MPLTGEAKADYQRKYRTPYMRRYRAQGRDHSRDLVETPLVSGRDLVETSVETQIPGLVMDGNRIMGISPVSATKVPQPYIPGQHYQPGETVLVQRGRQTVEAIIPRLDADGNPMPEY